MKAFAICNSFQVVALVLLPALCGCGRSGSVYVATPEVTTAVADNNAFALVLYQQLKEQPGNLIFSPYSISAGSAMTYAGARGQTATEMAGALHFTLPSEKLHAAFGALAASMHQVQHWNRITLTTANALWGQRDYPFTPAFQDLIRKSYRAEARLVDFKNPEPTRTEINSWIADKTKQKIENAVGPGQLTPDTRLVLCSAIYFNGKWASPFDEKNTRPMPFYLTKEQTVTVPTMVRRKSAFRAMGIEGLSLLELPYAGNDLSMIILLPDAVEGLPDLESQLNLENLSKWLDQLARTRQNELAVWLPRFKTSQSLDLKMELSALGMPTLFDQTTADLSDLTGKPDLYISDAVHRAFIEVNESGTEAAAATWFAAKSKGMTSSFRVDHPFIFLIRENRTGSILFLGRIVDPTT